MRYNNQISFPYPCLREITDDFIKGKFSVTYEPTIPPKQNIVKFKVVYNLTNDDILDLVKEGSAKFVTIFTSTATFNQISFSTRDSIHSFDLDATEFRDKVRIESFVVVNNDIEDFESDTLNDDYSKMQINFSRGDVIAQNIPENCNISRNALKHVSSCFKYHYDEKLEKGDFKIQLEEDDITILFSSIHLEAYTQSQNNPAMKGLFLNSMYYPVLIHVIERLQSEEASGFTGLKWYDVVTGNITNIGMNLNTDSAYEIATALLKRPFNKLSELLKQS